MHSVSLSPRQAVIEAGYSLFHFITRSGDEGSRCVEALESAGQEALIHLNGKALAHLRRREIEQGLALILKIDDQIGSLSQAYPSFLQPVLRGCWYHGAVAYYHYCVAAFDEANAELNTAYDSLAAAITDQPCLLPLLEHLLDFRMQHSRIARQQSRWSEVRSHLEILRDMIESRYPLCYAADGHPLFLCSLDHFYSLISLNSSERTFVDQQILDFPRRLRNLDLSIVSLCTEPGFVIIY